MQACSEPSTAPHFVRGDKVTIVTQNLFLRRQPDTSLRDRQLRPFTIEEQIGKHIYKLKLPTTIRLHPVFHANNYSFAATWCSGECPIRRRRGVRRLSHMCCVHQVIT
jgi:hypothetical protein